MSLRRQLLVSFCVQGVGAAAVLLATLWLGSRLGPDTQGGFSRTKSEVEFIAAFAMFGLPQALFFHVKSGRLGGTAALRWTLWSTLLALGLGASYAALRHAHSGAWLPLALGAAVAACVAHGQLRALLLVREGTAWFNGVTALPQVLVLVGVLAVSGWGIAGALPLLEWLLLFAIAYGIAAVLAWPRLRARVDTPAVGRVGWRELGHFGAAAWLTAALSTAAILTVQHWVEAAEGRTALGQFTMAMTLVQVPLTPISYAAPLLFRRWMEQPGLNASWRWAGKVFVGLIGVAGLVWLAASVWPDLGLGAAYGGATRALALLLVGGAAEAASRVLAVQANASGLPWVAVRAELARWGVLVGGWLLPLPHGLLPLCGVWAGAAAVASLVVAWHARTRALASRGTP